MSTIDTTEVIRPKAAGVIKDWLTHAKEDEARVAEKFLTHLKDGKREAAGISYKNRGSKFSRKHLDEMCINLHYKIISYKRSPTRRFTDISPLFPTRVNPISHGL